MLERTMAPLVKISGVRSVALFEGDGFVIYRSHEDATNHDSQMGHWTTSLEASAHSDQLTFILEDGTVMLRRGKRLNMTVHCAPNTNLGEVRKTLESCHNLLHNLN